METSGSMGRGSLSAAVDDDDDDDDLS